MIAEAIPRPSHCFRAARAKDGGRLCEDVVACCPRHGRFAVSDGASVSFDSRGWARTLCFQFLSDPHPGARWLAAARHYYSVRHPLPPSDWLAHHAAERGSFATLLGVTITTHHIVVHAIGDTAIFILRSGEPPIMYPSLSAEHFRQPPSLLCDRPGRSAFPETDEAFDAARHVHPVPDGGWRGTQLIILTDALAEWVVLAESEDEQMNRLREAADHRTRQAFVDWAASAIESGRVRRDDCAVLALEL